MEESDIEIIISQKLIDFEKSGDIQVTEEWSISLMKRLSSSKSNSSPSSSFNFAFVILFIFLINIGFFLEVMLQNSNKKSSMNTDFQAISRELLINPVSIHD